MDVKIKKNNVIPRRKKMIQTKKKILNTQVLFISHKKKTQVLNAHVFLLHLIQLRGLLIIFFQIKV